MNWREQDILDAVQNAIILKLKLEILQPPTPEDLPTILEMRKSAGQVVHDVIVQTKADKGTLGDVWASLEEWRRREREIAARCADDTNGRAVKIGAYAAEYIYASAIRILVAEMSGRIALLPNN